MKLLKSLTIILFAVVIALPLCFFNTTPDAISEIDNRKLTGDPFKMTGDLTVNLEKYVNDRIGLRDEAITAYTILNDRLFGKMVHPSYSYGKDGYVFGAGLYTDVKFEEFHIVFADMVAEIQKYCEQRNVPFLFAFNPAKPAVYPEKVADGVNYNRDWVKPFLAELDKRGITYVDTTETLTALKEQGIHTFNQKYDANHWNDLGAFYGTQAMLKKLSEQCDNIHVNQLEEFHVGKKLEESLQISKFPIHEEVPAMGLKAPITHLYNDYFPELKLHPSYQGFGYKVNSAESVKDTPKALVFQGSYMNVYGDKYLQNAFREYIHVHDYQNVIDFPYYFNIFQPECVIFEVAEYTLNDLYFSYENMGKINYNPALSTVSETTQIAVENENITAEKGNTLTTITWKTEQTYAYVWMGLDNTYDMQKVAGGYQVTVENTRYEAAKDSLGITVCTG